MTAPVTVDIEVYRNRAANTPQPASHAQAVARLAPEALNVHDPEMALQLATTQANYFADWSEYQQVVTSAYAYPISMHRFFSGYRTDSNCAANWRVIDAAIGAGRIRVAFTYPVFVPGQFTAMMSSLKNQFGAQCPTNRLVPVLDMESGGAFAGPGNHSPEANDWAMALAEYAGTPDYARSHGYANAPDFRECWPQIVPLIPKHTAAYTSVNPDSFAWQYQGGNISLPAPAGAPRSYAPFGTYVDGNVIYQSLDQIERILGITEQKAVDMAYRLISYNSTIFAYNPMGMLYGYASAAELTLDCAVVGQAPNQVSVIDPHCMTDLLKPNYSSGSVPTGGLEICDQAHFEHYQNLVKVYRAAITPATSAGGTTGGPTADDIATAIAAKIKIPSTVTLNGPIEGTLQ